MTGIEGAWRFGKVQERVPGPGSLGEEIEVRGCAEWEKERRGDETRVVTGKGQKGARGVGARRGGWYDRVRTLLLDCRQSL